MYNSFGYGYKSGYGYDKVRMTDKEVKAEYKFSDGSKLMVVCREKERPIKGEMVKYVAPFTEYYDPGGKYIELQSRYHFTYKLAILISDYISKVNNIDRLEARKILYRNVYKIKADLIDIGRTEIGVVEELADEFIKKWLMEEGGGDKEKEGRDDKEKEGRDDKEKEGRDDKEKERKERREIEEWRNRVRKFLIKVLFDYWCEDHMLYFQNTMYKFGRTLNNGKIFLALFRKPYIKESDVEIEMFLGGIDNLWNIGDKRSVDEKAKEIEVVDKEIEDIFGTGKQHSLDEWFS